MKTTIKISVFLVLFCHPMAAFAADMSTALEDNGTMTVVRGSMITLCLAIAFVAVAVKSSLEGESVNVSHLAMRLLFVVLALMAAGKIQGFVWGMGESIASNFLPGPSLQELHSTLQTKVETMQAEHGTFENINPITNTTNFFNYIAYQIMLFLESGALTIYFLVFKWFQAMHHVVMMFLAAMAPFMITASIIPGVRGFTNWLKLVISVALWPVVAAFFLKSHLISAAEYFGGATQPVFTPDASNFYLNMDALQLFSESCLFGIFLLATPLIASAIVSGSASVFAAGSVFLMGAGPLAMMRRSTRLLRGGGRMTGTGAKILYDGSNLVRHPTQAPRMIGGAIKTSLANSAKFKLPAAPKAAKGGGA
jgi:hypothetical protein